MKKAPVLFLVLFLFVYSVSASTQISIYLDDNGDALFLGETTTQNVFPEGITVENGKIRGITQELTFKEGNTWRFTYSLANSELNVLLPEGAEIVKLDSGSISLDDSRFSIYTPGSINVYYRIENNKSNTIWIIVLIVLLIAAMGLFFYFKNKPKKNSLEPILGVLNNRERQIISMLGKTGKVKSSHLRKLVEMPKASFSRHVHELERKKLVVLEGEGKNKFVRLT